MDILSSFDNRLGRAARFPSKLLFRLLFSFFFLTIGDSRATQEQTINQARGAPIGSNYFVDSFVDSNAIGLLKIDLTATAREADLVNFSTVMFHSFEFHWQATHVKVSTQMSNKIFVSSADELMTALTNATGGESILLAPGDYGDLSLYDARQPFVKFASEVTIRSADPDDPAVITSMRINGVENLTFDAIKFDYDADSGAPDLESPFVLKNSLNITIKNSTFDGDVAEGLGAALDGYGTGHGLTVRDSSGILIESNEFYNFKRAGVFNGVDGLIVRNNDIHDIRSDGLDFANVDNALIEANYIHDFKKAPLSTDHMDMIQFWTNGTDDPSTNIIITQNILDSGGGSETHSIFMRNEMVDTFGAGLEMYYQNITIEDNVIYNAHTHGINVGETIGLTIQGNTILQNPDTGSDGLVNVPTISLSDASQDVVVANNILPRLSLTSSSEFTVENNLVVQGTNPEGANYVGDLFVNALAGASATLADLKALPEGAIADLAVGSTLTQFDTTPEKVSGFVVSEAGTGLELLQYSFEIPSLYGPEGELDLEGAKFSWDFGDGQSAENVAVSHKFAKAGSYEVSATVTLADGRVVEIAKTIDVETPVALKVDFDNSAQDYSDIVNAVQIGEKVTFERDGDGRAVRLNGDVVTYEKSPDFFNNSEYSVLVDFKKDVGSVTDGGPLVYFSGSFVVFVKADGLSVAVTTDKGTTWLKANDIGIADSDWHSLALTFSGEDGAAVLYLDGEEIARATGLEGALQTGSSSHSLHLGNPWGDSSFTGLIDNFAFLRGALSAEQIAEGNIAGNQFDFYEGTLHPEHKLDNSSQSETAVQQETIPEMILPNRIDGTDGNDAINGTDGADEIHGNGGKDRIFARDGDDTVHLSNTNWGVVDGGGGNDLLFGGEANDILQGGDGDDSLHGGAGMDKLSGGEGNDLLKGGTDRDWLFGEAGNDVLIASDANYNLLNGGQGIDQLFGGSGRDFLFGGDGNDVLVGGEGRDDLTGGQGQDSFIFGPNSGQDRLLDFNSLEDIIVLQGLGDLTIADLIERAFDLRGDLILSLEDPDTDVSWTSSNHVRLVGISMEELTDANISLVA